MQQGGKGQAESAGMTQALFVRILVCQLCFLSLLSSFSFRGRAHQPGSQACLSQKSLSHRPYLHTVYRATKQSPCVQEDRHDGSITE